MPEKKRKGRRDWHATAPPLLLIVLVLCGLVAVLVLFASSSVSGPELAARGPSCNVKKSVTYTIEGKGVAKLQYKNPGVWDRLSIRQQAELLAKIAAFENMGAQASDEGYMASCIADCIKRKGNADKDGECKSECDAKLSCPTDCDEDPAGVQCTPGATMEKRYTSGRNGSFLRAVVIRLASCRVLHGEPNSYIDHVTDPPTYVYTVNCRATATCSLQCRPVNHRSPSPSGSDPPSSRRPSNIPSRTPL